MLPTGLAGVSEFVSGDEDGDGIVTVKDVGGESDEAAPEEAAIAFADADRPARAGGDLLAGREGMGFH